MKGIFSLMLLLYMCVPSLLFSQNSDNMEKDRIQILNDRSLPEHVSQVDSNRLEISARDAIQLAIENNISLKIKDIDLEIKKRAKDFSFNVLYPSIATSATMAYPHSAPTITDPMTGAAIELDHIWNLSLSASFNLNLSAALLNGVNHTFVDYHTGTISREAAEKKIKRDVKKNYFQLLVLKESIAVTQQSLETARGRFEQASINYRNGLVSELTMLSSKVAYENMKPAITDMRIGYQSAVMAFKQVLGIDYETQLILTQDINQTPVSLDADVLIDKYTGERLDLRELVSTLNMLENQRMAHILRTYTPALSLGLRYTPVFLADPLDADLFDVENNWDTGGGGFSITLAMDFSGFLPFSSAQIKLADINSNIEKTRLGIIQLLRLSEMEIRSLVMKLEKSHSQIEALELNAKLAERAFLLAEDAFNSGNKELLDVQNAENEMRKAKLEVLREKYNYITGLSDLEYILNTKLR